jgi:GNAT superfamily N-acetyltransferase
MEMLVDYFGYFASTVVAISLLMSSIIRLRWVNMVGSLLFTTYGVLIQAYPVALLNFCIVCINIYHLTKIYSKKEHFKLVSIPVDSQYFTEFLSFHETEIRKFFPNFRATRMVNEACFFVLRDAHVAGIFLAQPLEKDTLLITLDYVIPEYRDFKVGQFVFNECPERFRKLGYNCLASALHTETHNKYLLKMGFTESQVGNSKMMLKKLTLN